MISLEHSYQSVITSAYKNMKWEVSFHKEKHFCCNHKMKQKQSKKVDRYTTW